MYTNKQKQTALDFYDRLDFSRPKLRTGSDNTPEHPRKHRHPLPKLLQKLQTPRSSYYYHQKLLSQPDKYADLRIQIKQLFNESSERYGYRRIHALL